MTLTSKNKVEMKQITEFPNYYITNNGRVWSKPRPNTKGGFLKLEETWNGRLRVCLFRNNKPFRKQVHRLVLETFIGSCPKGLECRHLNGISSDNRLSNLKWGTRTENIMDSIKHGTHRSCNQYGENNIGGKLTKENVKFIRKEYNKGTYFQRELAAMFGVTQACISEVVSYKYWK